MRAPRHSREISILRAHNGHRKVPAIARLFPTILSTPSSIPTANGARPPITVTSGSRARPTARAVGVPTPTATGFIPTPDGPGFRKNRLAGPRFTTDAGHACAISDGSGFRAMNGRRRGFHGVKATTTSAGRRCRRKRASIGAPAFIIGPTTIMTSARSNTASLRRTNSARRASKAPSCRPSAT
jgi:hypothetical protein